MGLFDSFREGKELEKLEKEALRNPSPLSLVAFAERLMTYGHGKRAAKVVKDALERFPDSDKVRSSYQLIMKTTVKEEINELQDKLEGSPDPSDFERLAMIYLRDLESQDKALEIVRKGLALHPDYSGLHYVDGLVRLDRFHDEFIPRDGEKALHHLETAVRLNPNNYKAKLMLARLCAEADMFARARATLDDILSQMPGDEAATTFRELISTFGDGKDDPDFAFMDVAERGELSEQGHAVFAFFDPSASMIVTKINVQPDAMGRILTGLKNVDGYRAAVSFREDDGSILAKDSAGGLLGDTMAEALQKIFLAATDSSKRLDIGGFVRGVLECPMGRFHIVHWKNIVIAALTHSDAKKDEVEREMDEIIDALATK
jgi:tetratricopeptide (TPR) repeat protein